MSELCVEDLFLVKRNSQEDLALSNGRRLFTCNPSAFQLYGVTLDLLDKDQILTFFAKVVGSQICDGEDSVEHGMSGFSVGLLVVLAKVLRVAHCACSAPYRTLQNWDMNYVEAMRCYLLPSSTAPAWKRVCKQTLLTDLTGPALTGNGNTIVRSTMEVVYNLMDAVQLGDTVMLKVAVLEASRLSVCCLPRSISIPHLNGWTLLHLAAAYPAHSAEFYQVLVKEIGCEVGARDWVGQNALHIAAACLNHTVVLVLSQCARAVRATDAAGRTPAQVLLQALCRSAWRKRVSSLQVQHMLLALVPVDCPELWWDSHYEPTTQLPVQSTAARRSTLFFSALVYTDDFVAQEVIRVARMVPVTPWMAEVAVETLFRCVRSVPDRADTVELLLQEYYDPLERKPNEDMLALLDACLCHAVVTAGRHPRLDRPVLVALLNRLSHLLPDEESADEPSAEDGSQAVPQLVFVFFAVLRGDAALLTLILASLPRGSVRNLLYLSESAPFSTAFLRRFEEFGGDGCAALLQRVLPGQHLMSPLCLACVLGDANTLHALLRAAYAAPPRRLATSGLDERQRAQCEHFHAVLCCARYGRHHCLRILKNMFSPEAFYELCFLMTDETTGSTVFHALLHSMGTAQQSHAGHHSFSKVAADFVALADCLKMLLDVVPIPSVGSPAPSLVPCLGLHGFTSPTLAASLQAQLMAVQEAMHTQKSKSEAHERILGALSGRATDSIGSSPELQPLAEKWRRVREQREAVAHKLRASTFLSNTRLLVKCGAPDKKWIKLAYCLGRLIALLKLDLPYVTTDEARDSANYPGELDLSSWTALVTMLSKLVRGGGKQLPEFQSGLLAALEDSSAATSRPGVDPEVVSAETQVIERILADNQMVVSLRAKAATAHFPFETAASPHPGDEVNVPHYQSELKPDHHAADLYTALLGWVHALASSSQLRVELAATALSGQEAQGMGMEVTALDYVQHRQLQDRERRLQSILACIAQAAPAFSIPPSALSWVAYCGQTTEDGLPSLAPLQALLQASGVMPAATEDRIKGETGKVKNYKTRELVACVLTDYHARLGGDATGLVSCLLPLCAHGMWQAAEAALLHCSKAKALVNTPAVAKGLFHVTAVPNPRAAMMAYVEAVGHAPPHADSPHPGAVHQPELSCTILTPLHFAVLEGKTGFIRAFLHTFDSASLDLLSVVDFALDVHAMDMAVALVAHSVHCGQLSRASLPLSILDDEPRGRYGQGAQKHQLRSASVRTCATKQARATAYRELLVDALRSAERSAQGTGEGHGLNQDSLYVTRTDAATSQRYVQLMDGTEAPWAEVVNNTTLLMMALPVPQMAGGLLGTGSSMLHEACRQGQEDLVVELLLQEPAWRERIFAVNSRGQTPIYLAIRSGNYNLALRLLQQVAPAATGVTRVLDDLYVTHSRAGNDARAGALRAIIAHCEQRVAALEDAFYVPRLPRAPVQDHSMRAYRIDSCSHALSWHLAHIGQLWQRICTADGKVMMHLLHRPACAQLESVIRSRQALALLGIPLSQLVVTGKAPVESKQGPLKDFASLCPGKLRKLVSGPTSQQLRSLVCGWYRLRSASPPSALDDTLFLFRNVDVPITELGRSGQEASRYLRQRAAYVRACDRVSSRGVPAGGKQPPFGQLCEQLKLEMRFDATSAGKENFLRQGHINAVEAVSPGGWPSKVTTMLQAMQVDASMCTETLALAYLVLEFCRSVYVARQLVAMTSTPATSSAQPNARAESHPLDALHAQVVEAGEHLVRVKLLLDSDGNSNSASSAAGVTSRISVCAFVTLSQIESFLTLEVEASPRFSKLRATVVEGLSCLLLDHGHPQLSEFVCRAGSFSTASTDQTAGGAVAKFGKITDVAVGALQLLTWLQSCRVQDLLTSTPALRRFADEHAQVLRELSDHSSDTFREKVGELVAGTAGGKQDEQLRDAYVAAQAIFRLISAAAHLPSTQSMYANDVCGILESARTMNPLLSLCAHGAQELSTPASNQARGAPPRLRARAQRSQERLRLSCCESLLAMGADPTDERGGGGAPLVVAALTGNVDLLRACLNSVNGQAVGKMTGAAALVWHVIVASIANPSSGYEQCITLLLEHDFPTESPTRCDYSTLEVALIAQVPAVVLAALVAKRVPMTPQSTQRGLHWLLLRESPAPLQVAEALLFAGTRAAGNIFEDAVQVPWDLCGASFQAQVLAAHAFYSCTIPAAAFGPVDVVVRKLKNGMAGALNGLAVSLRRRTSLPARTQLNDLLVCAEHLRDGGEQMPSGPGKVSLLERLSVSAQEAVVAHVLRISKACLLASMKMEGSGAVQFCLPAADGEVAASPTALVDVVCAASLHGIVALLNALEDLHAAWLREHVAVTAMKPETAPSAEGRDDEAGITRGSSEVARGLPSWDDVLNSAGLCRGLKRACTPVEEAVLGRQGRAVAHLCARGSVRVLASVAVSAIARGELPVDMLLVLLKRAAPSAVEADNVCLEYASMIAFLSATEHSDGTGKPVISGETILHVCCRRGHAPLVQHLLTLGANAEVVDAQGYSALQYSVAAGAADVTRVLFAACPERIRRAVQVLAYAARKVLLRRHGRRSSVHLSAL